MRALGPNHLTDVLEAVNHDSLANISAGEVGYLALQGDRTFGALAKAAN